MIKCKIKKKKQLIKFPYILYILMQNKQNKLNTQEFDRNKHALMACLFLSKVIKGQPWFGHLCFREIYFPMGRLWLGQPFDLKICLQHVPVLTDAAFALSPLTGIQKWPYILLKGHVLLGTFCSRSVTVIKMQKEKEKQHLIYTENNCSHYPNFKGLKTRKHSISTTIQVVILTSRSP